MKTKIIKWNTAVSNASRLWMSKLIYDGSLTIMCGAILSNEQKEIEVSFGERPIFRDIQEEFMSPLWQIIFSPQNKIGNTFILEQSRWLEDLNRDEIFAGTMKDCRHYVLATEDDVIEVVTANEPTFKILS
jgi:hypothetical protein